MNNDLKRLETLYSCQFYKSKLGKQEFLELHTINKFTRDNLNHIKHILKQHGFYFYTVEACGDYLIIKYYRK